MSSCDNSEDNNRTSFQTEEINPEAEENSGGNEDAEADESDPGADGESEDTAEGEGEGDDNPAIAAADVVVAEGQTASVELTLSAPAEDDLTVAWTLVPDQEGNSGDFSQTSGEIVLTAGNSSLALELTPVWDRVVENEEIFTLSFEVVNQEITGSSKLNVSDVYPLFLGLISSGGDHSCALKENRNFCWGGNDNGEAGIGVLTANQQSPTPVATIANGASKFAAQQNNSCAISQGALYCWGNNLEGQLGSGAVTPPIAEGSLVAPEPTPATPPGLENNVADVAVGAFHTCAVQAGKLLCWGRNVEGQIGTAAQNQVRVLTPQVPIGLDVDISQVAAGSHHTCAIKNAALYCWGENRLGQLGAGDVISPQFAPRLVPGFEADVTSVFAGEQQTCAIKAGKLYCWGRNNFGQLGLGNTTSPITSPTEVIKEGFTIEAVTIGGNHTCAFYNDKKLYCFGFGANGRLGLGDEVNYTSPNLPVPLAEGEPIVSFAAGFGHTCVLQGNKVFCFGVGSNGQMGNGAFVETNLSPVESTFPQPQ